MPPERPVRPEGVLADVPRASGRARRARCLLVAGHVHACGRSVVPPHCPCWFPGLIPCTAPLCPGRVADANAAGRPWCRARLVYDTGRTKEDEVVPTMKVTPTAAMRARDVSRPHAEHLAYAEAAEASAASEFSGGAAARDAADQNAAPGPPRGKAGRADAGRGGAGRDGAGRDGAGRDGAGRREEGRAGTGREIPPAGGRRGRPEGARRRRMWRGSPGAGTQGRLARRNAGISAPERRD
jgi:hypothetical protein